MPDYNLTNFFRNNRIFRAPSIPTKGTFKIGDMIVNTGETSNDIPIWICIESGTPGVWQPVGVGGGGGGSLYTDDYENGQDIQIEPMELRLRVETLEGEILELDTLLQVLDSEVGGKMGNLDDLTTQSKDTLVNSINELKQSIDSLNTEVNGVVAEGIEEINTLVDKL